MRSVWSLVRKIINSYPQKLYTGGTIITTRPRLTLLLDRIGTMATQSPSRAHRDSLRRVGRGVLACIVISLLFMPEAGGTIPKQYISHKEYALHLLGYNYVEYRCLLKLYGKESAWNPAAVNGSHYGIPQGRSEYLSRVDGYKQVVWGLNYIGHRYGEPCIALDHWIKYNWH